MFHPRDGCISVRGEMACVHAGFVKLRRNRTSVFVWRGFFVLVSYLVVVGLEKFPMKLAEVDPPRARLSAGGIQV